MNPLNPYCVAKNYEMSKNSEEEKITEEAIDELREKRMEEAKNVDLESIIENN